MRRELVPGQRFHPSEVLKQEGQILLLDQIANYGADWVEATVAIDRQSLFADAEGVPSWVGIEYMAQTASAFSGILQRQSGEPVTIALLLGTRRYRATADHFCFDSVLRIRAALTLIEPGGLAAFDCDITDANNDHKLATAQIKAYRPPDLADLLARIVHERDRPSIDS